MRSEISIWCSQKVDSDNLERVRMEIPKNLETLEAEDVRALVKENDVVLNFFDNVEKVGNAIVEDQAVKLRKHVEEGDLDAIEVLKKCNASGGEEFPSVNCGFDMGKTDCILNQNESCSVENGMFVEIEGMEEDKAVELETVDSSIKVEVSDPSGINQEDEFLNFVMNEKISTKAGDEMKVMDNDNLGSVAAEKEETGGKFRRKRRINKVEDPNLMEMISCGQEKANSKMKMECRSGDIDCGSEEKDDRARKKSKYLSYPYINSAHKTVPGSGGGHFLESHSISKRSRMNFWRKWYRKFAIGRNRTVDPELTNASSVEFLYELHFAAVDCCHPKESKNFGSIALFFSKFRMSEFTDESVYNCPEMTAEPFSSGSNLIESEKKNSKPAAKIEKRKRKGQATSNTSMARLENSEINHSCKMDESNGNPHTLLDSESPNMDIPSPKIEPKIRKVRSKRPKTKCLSGLSDVDISITASSELVKDSLHENPKQKKRKKEGSSGIPDLNRIDSISTLLPDVQLAANSVASRDKSTKKKGNKREAIVKNPKTNSETLDVSGSQKPDSFFIDLHVVPQSMDVPTQQHGLVGKEVPSFSLDFGQLTDSNSFQARIQEEIGPKVSPENKFGDRKRETKKKTNSKPPHTIFPADIPDLNGNTIEPNSATKEQTFDGIPPHTKPKRRRRKKGDSHQLTVLHLTFSSGSDIPSKEEIITVFSRFGSLKESGIHITKDSSTARIIFLKSENAGEAIQSLDKNNPFGKNLLKYHLLPESTTTSLASPPLEEYMKNLKLLRLSPCSSEAPAIEFIRHNLHMMTVLLEKSGDNLSPEMRVNLEDEIRGLLKKLSSIDGSPSA